MVHKLLSMALLGACCLLVANADDAKPAPGDAKPGERKFGKFDKTKMFEKMDTNSDGKITKDEYTKSLEAMMERLKDKLPAGKGGNAADFAGRRFDSMDADKDGSVTKEEFEKADVGFGGGNFKGK